MQKFWVFTNKADDTAELYINGDIIDDFDKEIREKWCGLENTGTAPSAFRAELKEVEGKNLTVYIDSYGGDVFAASDIYTMLKEHKGDITVKITGVAASAASVIAMAGDKVLMSSTAVMMIHNPSTIAAGDHNEMEKAAEVLDTIKNGIINAYHQKTGLPKDEISDLMEQETWFDCDSAIEKGFCDGKIDEAVIPQNVVEDCLQRKMFVYNSIKKPQFEEIKAKLQTAAVDTDAKEPVVEEPQPVIDHAKAEADKQMLEFLKLKSKL